MCEILAPCGDKNTAFVAINSGADAIYLGLKNFSARDGAGNFTLEEFTQTVNYAAIFGVKVYVALNTVIKQSELKDFFNTVCAVWNAGADAVILQDIYLGAYIKKRLPEVVLHLSTQGGVCNRYGAYLAKDSGFDRVILARETKIEDIKEIAQIIETEVFVQGALCASFSGQCYFSSFAGGNSGNRGRCKQPCRKLYSIDRAGYEDLAYRLSTSDLCIGNKIDELVSAGVKSFKIEGRMRRAEYVAAAIGYYKRLLSGEEADISPLKRTYNRGNYTHGLAFGQEKNFLSSAVQGHIGEYVGIIKVVNGKYFCQSNFQCSEGDCFKILRGGKEAGGAKFGGSARGGFYLDSNKKLYSGDKAFITTDVNLNGSLTATKRTKTVTVSADFKEGCLPAVTIDGVTYIGAQPLESARERGLCKEDVITCFNKLNGLPLTPVYASINVSGKPFMNMAALNAFRRDAYRYYIASLAGKSGRNAAINCNMPDLKPQKNNKSAVIGTNLNNIQADIFIYKPADYSMAVPKEIADFKGEKYLYLPPFMGGNELAAVKNLLGYFNGIYCDGTYGVYFAKEVNKDFFAGTGFNITNSIAANAVNAKYYCISKEISIKEADALSLSSAFYLSGGGIKVMDLKFCPFSLNCKTCDKRGFYTLADGDGRKFPLRRYVTEGCRFEVYNCAYLTQINCGFAGKLYDNTIKDGIIKQTTNGHTRLSVL